MSTESSAKGALLRRNQVEQRTGLARSTVYKLIATGDFPPPIKLTRKAVAWPEAAIDAWVQARISGHATL